MINSYIARLHSQVSTEEPSHVLNFNYLPAITAFVDATAGIILFTTPATF